MNEVDTLRIASVFPALQARQRPHSAEDSPPPASDFALEKLCAKLCEDQQGRRCFGAIEPEDWEGFNRDSVALQDLIQRIANTRATSRIGLRAKALALHALLDEGGGDLYEDAAMPDRLAWSLVQDILAG